MHQSIGSPALGRISSSVAAMARGKVLVFLWVCVCQRGIASSAPFIEPCREGDKQCLLRSATKALPAMAAGVPALGIHPLDPMRLGKVSTDNAGLNMEFRNTIIKGLKDSHVVKLVKHGNHMEMTLKCSLELKGEYTMSGKLLVMPIEGDGKYRIRIRDMMVHVTIEFGERHAGADAYWKVQRWSQESKVETGADFRFQNLFKGNKKLSDGIHEFANSNWREIFAEVAPPIIQEAVGQIVGEVSKLFNKVPVRELTKH